MRKEEERAAAARRKAPDGGGLALDRRRLRRQPRSDRRPARAGLRAALPAHRQPRAGAGRPGRGLAEDELSAVLHQFPGEQNATMNMRHKKSIIFAGVVTALLLAGCASAPERVLSLQAPAYAALPNGYGPLNPGKVSPMFAAMAAAGGNFVRQLERRRGHALNILSLSGGGQNGAFGAGLLNGWRESGQRPEFDMVGGVSTGALLATHALLGTPADDAQLEEMYTQISKKDVHTERGIFSLALGADSLSDTSPLRALIAKFITADTLTRVAAAYNDDRFLFVGTTNIDYGQTWVWNMSLIAKDWQPRAVSSGVARLCIVPHRLSAGGNRRPPVRRRGRPFECRHRGTGRGRRAPRLRCMGRGTYTWSTTAGCRPRPRPCAGPSATWQPRPSA